MAEEKCGCDCNAAPTLIFSCSGAADVGGLADQAARELSRDRVGNMYCLAGLGAQLKPFIETTAQAGKILAIDGCPQGCAKHTLKAAGFDSIAHLLVTDLGLKKGRSPVTAENIAKVATQGREMLK